MKRRKTIFVTGLLATCSLALLLIASVTVLAAQRGGGTGGGTGAGTGGGRGPVAVPPSTGARGGRATLPPARTETSPSAIAVKNAVARVKAINKAVASLDKLAAKTAPKNAPAADQEQWADQGKWIRAVKGRYAAYGETLDTATKSSADSMDVLLKLTELDEQFVALQVSTEEEGAKFSVFSKAAKSRHDSALKALKEIK